MNGVFNLPGCGSSKGPVPYYGSNKGPATCYGSSKGPAPSSKFHDKVNKVVTGANRTLHSRGKAFLFSLSSLAELGKNSLDESIFFLSADTLRGLFFNPILVY